MTYLDLQKISTRAPKRLSKKKTMKENKKLIADIQADQYKLYAEHKRSMLIVLQGLDASGKDGVVRYIFSGMNPLGTRATSFRVPTKEELSHDFLRRIHEQTPEKGMVQIFNRSHYEDILVPSVEKYLSSDEIDKRYEQINNFEKMLHDNDTIVLKFYLHISKDKQKEKLNERLTDPTKYWKHNIGDWQVRHDYNKYIEVYEEIFKRCDKPERHIIPSDQNRYKINCIAKIIHKTFKDMNLKWPRLSEDQETALLRAKAELAEEREEDKKEKTAIHDNNFEKKVQEELKKEIEKLKKKETKILEEKKQTEEKQKKKLQKKKAKEEKKKAKKLAKESHKKAKQEKKHTKKDKDAITPPSSTKKPPLAKKLVVSKKPILVLKKKVVPSQTSSSKKPKPIVKQSPISTSTAPIVKKRVLVKKRKPSSTIASTSPKTPLSTKKKSKV